MPEKKVKLMIDSGAFSAWRKHEPINVDDYIAYVKKHEHLIDEVVNLDVIPGVYPKPPTAEEREASAQEGWDNLMRMADAGIKAIPVYHQGERFYWLDKMFNAGYDYIGISPDNTRALSSKKEWLNSVFRDICDSDGNPVFKPHGFAVTAVELMFKYPWYTYDSMTWLLAASYGGVFIPKPNKHHKQDGFDYTRVPFTIKISKESPNIELDAPHYDKLTTEEKENCKIYFESEGFTVEDLRGSFVPRTILNLRYLRRVESPYGNIHFKDRNSFFPESSVLDGKGITDKLLEKLITAINLARKYSDILTEDKKWERLFTYGLLRETQDGFLDTYVYTGRMPVKDKA